MSSQEDHLLRDLYGDDYNFYQDYYSRGDFSWPTLVGCTITVTLLILGLVYTVLYALDFGILSLPELVWNWLVYIVPSRLLNIVDNDVKSSVMADLSFARS